MKKALACTLVVLTFFISFSLFANVIAKNSVILNVSKSEVNLGEDIVVSINVDTNEKSLYAYTAKLSYDKDVFEVIDEDDFEEQENWSDIMYNKANNKFALINKEGVSGDKLLQVKLHVKEDAKAGKTAITVNSITASDGKKDIALSGSSVEVLVLKNGLSQGESIPTNKVDIPADDNTTIQVEKSVPVVGVLLVVLMLVIVVALICYYAKFSKEDSNGKKFIITAIALIILIILLVVTVKIFTTKNPDVDKDGDVDYDDSKDIMEYILEIERPQDDKEAEDKDLNNDGKITITDVANAVGSATNQEYTGNITPNPSEDDNEEEQPPVEPDYESSVGSSSVSSLTPNKGEDVTLDLNIDITPHTDVKSVIIDGKEYPVEKGEGNSYKVTIPVPEQAGLQDVVITGVVLDNGNIVETEYKVTLDVLKDMPKVDDFSINTEKEIPEVTVNVNDNDSAIKSGKVIVTDEEGNVVFESSVLNNGENTYLLDGLKKDKKYNVKVEVQYDLDSDKYGKPEDNSGNVTLASQDFVINADYGFEGTDYSITERVTDRDPLVLSFKNSYDSYYDVESVVINGQKYQVSKIGDMYQVVLEKGAKGANSVNIEEVVLQNGTSYDIDKKLEYIYLRNEPTIGDVEAELNDSKVKVKVNNNDADGAIKSVTVYLTDSEGDIVDSKVLEEGQDSIEFDVNESGDYKVKVEVTYDLGDGTKVTKTVEYAEEIKEPVKVTIVNSKIDSTYAKKGQKLEVTYTVETNTDDTIASFVINGITLNAVKNDDGTYTVSFNAPQDDGIAQLDVTKVVFTNEGEVETSDALEYEVLKSEKPVVDALSVVDKEENGKATLAFTINDEEDTFVKGRIVITNIATGEKTEKVFDNVEDTVHELNNVEDFENYTAEIYITYDLDIDKVDTENQYEERFAQTEFELIGNYEFSFSELEVDDVNRDKNVVVLRFKTTLAEAASDTYYIQSVVINGVTYPATLGENRTYTVEVPYTSTDRQELVVQEAILNNTQGFAITENNSVVVFKAAPTAIVRSTVTRELVDGLRTITASLQVIDEESTIVDGTLHARLLDPEGKQVDTLDLDVTAEEVVFNSDNIYDAGTYTIEVRADYNTVDGVEHNAEKLGDAKVGVAIYANIDKAEIDKYYVQKGEELKITYTISTNSQENVTGITVNGDILPAQKNDDGTYTVVVSAPDKYGKHTFEATRLVYANEQTSATNTKEVDVLRTVKPSISDIVVNDDNPDAPVLSFTITDEEDTFVSGKVIITGNGQEQELPIESKDNTTFVLKNIEEFKEYNVEIELTYDFDSNKEDNEHQDTITENSKFEVIGEYEFTLQNFNFVKVDTQRKVIVLSFESSNTSNYDIKKVFVNGSEYEIKSKDNNIYTIEIPYETDARLELTLDKVILANLKEFTNLEQGTIVVFKNKPTATITSTTVSDDMSSIKATYDIMDTDDVLSALCVRLVDAKGNVIETKDVEEHIKEVEFKAEDGVFESQEYKVEILADYDRADGEKHEEEVIASKEANVKIRANVISGVAQEYYVAKDSVIVLTYEIEANTDKELQSVVINGQVVTPRRVANGKYEARVNTPEVAGEYKYNLTELRYSEDEVINVENSIDVDVLKDTEPVVTAISVDTTLDKPLLSFTVTDEENTFVSGRIVITNTEDGEEFEIPFDSLDSLSFELDNIEEFTKYDVDVFITYDLDSDKENTVNQQTKLLAEKQFEAIGDYEFTFSNFRVKKVDTQNEVIVLEFESTNASEDNDQYDDYYVDTVVINGNTYENVEKNGTTYTVEVPYTQMNRTELVLEKAILNNLQDFTITEDNKVVVFKSLKAIVIGTVADDLKSIKADVSLTDQDNIAKDVYVRILNSQNVELAKQKVESENEIITFGNEDKYYDAGEYTIEVIASYDAVDGQTHEQETIVSTKVEVMTGAKIVSSNFGKYAKKGQELEVEYTLLTNTNEEVDTIVVNQVAYEAQKVKDGVYKVNVKMPERAGETDLQVTRINFKNDKSANVDYTSKVEVLKSEIPTVSNLAVGGSSDNPVLSFTITDPEETFVSGKYVIIDKESNERKEYEFTTKDSTSFLLPDIKEFNKYGVEVYITYDLDSDKAVGSQNQETTLAQEGQFEIIGEYNFTLENFRILEVNRDAKTVKLAFESSNASEDNDEYTDYYVNQVEINGETYGNITKDGKTYTLEIPYKDEERTELKLTKAILDNLKEFTNLQNSVVIFKDKPSVELNAHTDENQETITADITLTDNDKTLTHLNIKLVNPKGDVIETRDIDNDEVSVDFKSPENGIFKAGEYRIEVGADYELDDGLVHESKDKIGETTVKISTVASIQENKVENYYVQKGEKVKVNYTFNSNNDSDPTGIMVENALYSATRNDDGTYTVAVPADSTEYGLKKYTVSAVMYNGETVIVDSPVETEYYVLKDKPSIKEYKFNSLVKDQTITFELVNDEEAILDNAQVVIVDSEGKNVLTQPLQVGLNTVNLNTLANGKYTVKLEGTYDLDDNKDNNLNTYGLHDIFTEQEIGVISDYKAKLEIKDVKVDRENNEIVVTFTSENEAEYEVKSVVIDDNEYEAQFKDGQYIVKVSYDNEDNTEHHITGVKLENDIELELKDTQSFEVFKTAPSAQVTTQVADELNKITATFTLTDVDNTVKALYAKLLDKEGNVVGNEVSLDKTATSVSFDSTQVYKAGEYTVEIYADYELVDGKEHNKEKIGSNTATVAIKANIVSSSVTNKYAKKNSEIKVTYEITSNTDEELTSIVVNGKTLPASILEENKYEVTYKVKGIYGKDELVAQQLVYTQNVEVDDNTVEVYVLKDAPSITEYSFSDAYQHASVSFKFTDTDKALTDKAKVVLTKIDTNEQVLEKEINEGTNTIDLKELENSKYELKIVGNYDLDEEHENSENEYKIEDIFEAKEIEFINDYELTFKITKTEVLKEKSKAKVTFESTNAGKYQVSYVIIDGIRYPVVNEDGVSYALVDYLKEENQEMNISDVVLSNGVELLVKDGAKFEIFKKAPTISNLNVRLENGVAVVNLQVIDEANIMENAKVLLVNSTGETVQEVGIEKNSSTVTFEKVATAGTYTVKIVADYDSIDGEVHEQEELAQTNIKTPITAKITNDLTPTYAEKQKEIDVTYEIESNTVDKILKIEINGESYPVEETENGKYKITYTTGTNAGEEELKVTAVEYEGEKVSVEYSSSVEILKDELTIENFNVDTSTSQVVVTYNINDSDMSFVSGKIRAKNTKNNDAVEVDVLSGVTEYTLDLKDLEVYDVELEITYDRDNDYQNNEHQETKVYATQENVQSVSNYNLQVSDFRLDSVEKEVLFNANIKFKTTNDSIYPIYGVVIGDEEYQVTPVEDEEGTYLIEYPYGQEKVDVRQEITVSKIILENGAKVELEEAQSVVIFKHNPKAQVLELNSEDNSNIKVHFDLTDNDNTVTNIYVVLQNEQGEIVSEQSLSPEEFEATFTVSKAGTYSAVIKADYDRADGSTHSEEIISNDDSTVEIKPAAMATTEEITNRYPKKSETIELTYKIESNIDTKPTKVVINERDEYILVPVDEGANEYKISYNVSDTSQVQSLKVTKIYFGDNLSVDTPSSIADTIEILRDVPTITITSKDLLEQNSVIFTVNVTDPDDAMTSGVAKVHGQEENLNKGQTTFIVSNLEPDEEHVLNVEVKYDLDYNTIDKDQNEGTVTKDQNFKLVSDYGLTISNVKTFNKSNEEKKYFAKNETIELRFKCENKTSLVPEKVTVQDINDEKSQGIEYTVNAIEENGEFNYYVDIVTNGEAGEQEFKIISVTLSGSRVISSDKFEGENPTASIEVLKDKPTISNFSASNQENSVTVEFEIKDDDNALQESYILLISDDGKVEQKGSKVQSGKNTYTFNDLTPGKKYTIKVENKYSLSKNGDVIEDVFREQEIEITKKEESNLRVKNLTISKRVPIGSKVSISFENSLMSYEDVDTIIIDGKDYPVTKGENGVYKLTLDPVEKGVNKISVDGVKIKDKEFAIDRNLSYIYEYADPVAENVSEINEDTTTSEAVITYQLKDEDDSVIGLTAYMKNSAGSIIATKAIDLDTEVTKTVKMDLRKVSTYSVELRAYCDVGDHATYEEKTLFEVKKETKPRVTIVSQSIDKEYVEKGENVVLTFKINTNVDQEVKKISIDDESYKVTNVTENGKVVEDTYSITVQAPDTTGVFPQNIESIQIGSSLIDQIIYPEGMNPINIKVYKQKPTVTHFIIDENNKKVSFKVNDPDNSLTQSYPKLIIKQGEDEIHSEELTKGESEYEFNLEQIGMTTTQDEYNALVDATYDLRPDVQAEKQNIMQKIFSLFASEEPSTEGEEEEEDPNAKYIITENIFDENYKLSGEMTYNLEFINFGGLFTLWNYQLLNFDCSTGTNLKVVKAIIDGREYEVKPITKNNRDDEYFVQYKAFDVNQNSINFEKVILENGTALDIPAEVGSAWCMVLQTDPTLVIKDFIEDVNEETVTVKYKLVDNDGKLAYDKLTFTLMNSQGGKIESQVIENAAATDTVVFKVPYPPTAVYKLQVNGQLFAAPEWYEYLTPWTPINDSFNSSVNTSILGSRLDTKYPKRGETFAIDYTISSTKVIIIDKEDHTNQDKAVGITSLVINGKDYDVQALEDKPETYRIYYTAQDEIGLEDIAVKYIKFSNGDVEEFNHSDKIEVIKDAPYVTDFRSENDLAGGKVKLSFNVIDPDGVISTSNLVATIGNVEKQITVGSNSNVEFEVTKDQLVNFEIKATYDLDDNKLQGETSANDNVYTNHPIFERKLMLTGDYGVTLDNVKMYNSKQEETNYFEKNEDITLTFDCVTKNEALYPEIIYINGEEYTLNKVPETDNTYTITLPGSDKAQKYSAKINSIVLNSGNVVPLEDKTLDYEVLKDHVKVTDFAYDISDDNADIIKLSITVSDEDAANKTTKVAVIDEYGTKVETSKEVLSVGENNDITFKKTGAEKYTVSVYSTYDRDADSTDEKNYLSDIRIHNQIVSLTTRYIEMKDIVDIKLYTFNDLGNAVRVDSLTEDNLSVVDNSLVEVSMKNIPTFYSKVTSYRKEDGKLKLVLDYKDAMVYTGEDELKPLEVTLDILENTEEYEYKGSFKALIAKMKAHNNVGDVINLDKDYDLLDYPITDKQTAYIDFDYKGTLNGNGHTISNLTIPLFNKLDNAKVENLKIKNIVYTSGNRGVIANYATNSTVVSNVHVDNLVSASNAVSALIYEVSNKSVVEKCSATNITYNTTYLSQSISAGVVYLKNESKIENCYVQGTMSSGWWNNAGLVVSAENTCEINNNIVNMKMAAYYGFNESYGNGNGGIVGTDANNANSAGLKLKNNLSLVEGNKGVGAIYNYKRSKLHSESSNNYQLDTAVVKHENVNGVNTIAKEELDANFFRNTLNLDQSIWTISDDASIDNLPVLKGVSASYSDGGKQPKNTEIYIPDYNRVSELTTYEESREIAYHNMYKLMPFYDAKEIIRDGNKIPVENPLYEKVIKYVVPFNKDGKMVSHLTTEDYNSLDKIYIVFEDGTKLEYSIAFDDYYGNVASYMITELNVGYNYNNYVVDPNQDSIKKLIEEASKYDFKKDLDPVTEKVENDSRLYREHFENYTKYHIEDFVINLLVNMGYSPNFESDVLDDLIERELINTGELKKLLFAYNYFTYWYNLDMDGINLADATMFHSNEMFDKDMTMEYLTDQLVQGSNSATNGTAGFYNSYFVKYTKLSNLGYYLDYYVKTLTHYEKGIDWFKDHFKGGYYYDINVEGSEGLYYTLWDHLLKDGKVQTDFLPLMTVPENSMYVMSSPSQAYFGSLRVYMTDPNDPKQIEAFKAKVEKWLSEVQSFYTFAYNYWGPDNINKYCDTNYDMRYTYTGVGNITVYNNPLTTEEPYHKYFAEAIGRWPATHGGAYANGNEVFWAVIKMLDNFRVGTHETLHNQDSKIFLNGYGRRGGAEDYAAGFVQQYYRDGWVSPNIFDEEADLANPVFKDNVSQNLRKSSVENDDKLHAYYDKYFRVNDFLDWIEAKAYFTLTSDQKANISVQVSYPEVGPDQQDAGDDVVAYTPLTPDMVKNMKLDSMEDLWKNKIMLRPGVKDYERRSPGADTDSIFNIHWYQPHADNDRPDGANFKYIAWQMAGEGGYYEGLVPYYTLSYIGIQKGTGEKTTDLTALRYIMDDENITFESYKLDRYKELSEHYNDQGTYINAEEIYNEYCKALKEDADNKDRNLSRSTAVKKKYFQQIRLETNDFNIEPFDQKAEAATISLDEEQIEIGKEVVTTSEELISKIEEDPNAIITLGNDIDLTEYVEGEAVIDTVFSGTLDGNNYTISGNRLPIFNTLDGATVENIRIKNAMISADLDDMGVLSKTIKNSTITNVIVEDSTVYATDNVGGIAGLVDNSTFEDVHAKNVEITANNNSGGLVGYVKNNSVIQESSSNAKVNSNDDAVSTFVGRIESSEINNSYAVGSLVNKSTTDNLNVGGFVGYADNAVLQNNFVKAEMETPENVGGFIGEAVNTVNVNNNLSLSNLTNQGYKFDGRTDDKKLFSTDEHDIYMNNYELADTQGRATAQRNENINNVIVTVDSDMLTEEFFENELNFSTEIWDLSEVNNGGLPKLKNSDPNEELKLIEENESNVEEDLSKEEEKIQTDSEENVNEEILLQEQEEIQTENDEIIEDNSITVQDEIEEVPQVQDSEEDIVVQEDLQENMPEDEVIVVIPESMGIS